MAYAGTFNGGNPMGNGIKADDVYLSRERGVGGFVWNTAKAGIGVWSITVVAKGQPLIFAQIVGVLSLNDFDIIDARSFRQEQNTLVTVKVRVLPSQISEYQRLRQAEADLRAALTGGMNLAKSFKEKMNMRSRLNPALLAQTPPEVTVDNKSSFLFSLIQVQADDFPGVLFTITDTILRCDLDIWNTRIATHDTRIQDVFFVKDLNGRKIESPGQISSVQAQLRNAFSRLRYVF
jgi:[protein-PII] uridylyltransferase